MNSKIITIAQQKGGAGKTTLAINIAICLHQKGYKIALFDTDSQRSMSKWYEIRQNKLGEKYTGIKVFTGVGWKISTDISYLKKKYDFILIDNPPHAETDIKNSIKEADLVVMPCQPTLLDVWALENTINICHKENINYLVVPNRANTNSKNFKEIFGNINNLSENVLGNRVAMTNYLKEGKGVTELEPNSIAAHEIESLTNEIESIFICELEICEA